MKLSSKALSVARRASACAVVLVGAGCASRDFDAKIAWNERSDGAVRALELEDARTTNDGELEALLSSESVDTRIHAAMALGRMPFPEEGAEVTRSLLGALFDADASVRANAAFALGMRGDPSAADKLLFVALDHHEADREVLVRAAAIEAASKLDRPELRERVLDGLLDPAPEVRLEAAQGASRWPTTESNASAINQRLVDHLANEKDARVITYTLFALERRKAAEALEAFLRFGGSDDMDQRLFAARGLKALAPAKGTLERLVGHASNPGFGSLKCDGLVYGMANLDAYWRVACEVALALGSFDDPAAQQALTWNARRGNPHVERCMWESLGAQFERGGQVSRELIDVQPSSPSVRAAQVEAFARGIAKRLETIEFPSFDGELDYAARANLKDTVVRDAYTLLQRAGVDESFVVRAGAARAFAHTPDKHALPWLTRMAGDAHLAVAGAAIEGLAKHPTAESRKLLHELLAHGDNGLRLASVMALGEMPDASDVEPLTRCYATSNGDGANEIRFNVLRGVGKIGGDRAKALIANALEDSSWFVRRVAREEGLKLGMRMTDGAQYGASLRRSGDGAEEQRRVEGEGAPAPEQRRQAPHRAPAPGALDLAPVSIFPVVEVVTSRGTMRFALFPLEAPRHVHNFLTLAARDHYDGLVFHRVVPDFVIQGGDYRGDGNGGGTWRGRDDALRHEITPRKYVRGSLGMPRNEDPDSGGSQFFVTHRATPHLDGRYTIFGELLEGYEVLDAIEVGDTILDVRLAP